MPSPASRIALSAALSVASLTVATVHADDASDGTTEAAPPKEDAGVHASEGEGGDELTTGDDLLIELTIDALVGAPGGGPTAPKECKWQCCHTLWP